MNARVNAADLDPSVDYIFTIGHSNTSIEALLANLCAYGIEALVDVRSQPYSRFSPQFNRRAIEAKLASTTVQYVFNGEALGGRPSDSSLYDADGHVRYDALSATELFRSEIDALLSVVVTSRVAVMCSEEDPRGCHRHLLIARVVRERGFDAGAILHIRKDGKYETEESLPRQSELIDHSWRSPVSLVHKRQRLGASPP
jgi:uncharacterized protein (DUF488 family)